MITSPLSAVICILLQWNGTTQPIENNYGFPPPPADGEKTKVRNCHRQQNTALEPLNKIAPERGQSSLGSCMQVDKQKTKIQFIIIFN